MPGGDSNKPDGLVAGNAVVRELSHPKHNKYGMNILFDSKRFGGDSSASNSQRTRISIIVEGTVAYINGREVARMIDRV